MEPRTILVADDDPAIREVLRLLLTGEGYRVLEAADGGEAIAQLSDDIDLVILDVMMPGTGGYAACAEIRKQSAVPVLFLTAKAQDSDKSMGFSVGGDDYLVKPFSFLELLARLQVITKRVRTKEHTNIYIGDLHIDLLARRATRGSRRLDLTAKEFSLLEVLAQRQSQIVSKTVITELVWDICFDTNTNVVEATVKRLRAKLEQEGEPKLLHTIRGMGYVLEQR